MSPMVKITGNTYPVRLQIRDLGGKWNAGEKAWYVPEDKAEEARKLAAPVTGYKFAGKARRNWSPCGYPGCSPEFCEDCYEGGHR